MGNQDGELLKREIDGGIREMFTQIAARRGENRLSLVYSSEVPENVSTLGLGRVLTISGTLPGFFIEGTKGCVFFPESAPFRESFHQGGSRPTNAPRSADRRGHVGRASSLYPANLGLHLHEREQPMDTYRGDLLLDGKVVHPRIEFWIEEIRPPPTPSEWRGSFEAPTDKDFDWKVAYEIRLDDGRRGKLFVTNFDGENCVFQMSEGFK